MFCNRDKPFVGENEWLNRACTVIKRGFEYDGKNLICNEVLEACTRRKLVVSWAPNLDGWLLLGNMIVSDNRKPQHRRAIIGTTGYLHEFDLILIAAAKRHAELIILLIHLGFVQRSYLWRTDKNNGDKSLPFSSYLGDENASLFCLLNSKILPKKERL